MTLQSAPSLADGNYMAGSTRKRHLNTFPCSPFFLHAAANGCVLQASDSCSRPNPVQSSPGPRLS